MHQDTVKLRLKTRIKLMSCARNCRGIVLVYVLYQSIDGEWMCIFSGMEEGKGQLLYGAGILLNEEMRAASEGADALCEYGGERLVRIRFNLRGRFCSVVSCYAPTYNSPEEVKETVYENLGSMLSSDIGENERAGDVRSGNMFGAFGLLERNENGVLLSDFCASRKKERLRVASTYFQHRQYGTWLHQKSKKWLIIDHVLCSHQTMGLVTDMRAMPGYVHATDHRFLKLQLRLPHRAALGKFSGNTKSVHRDVRMSRLQTGGLQDKNVRDEFNLQLHDLMI